MTPIQFPQANVRYGPPPDLDESQCKPVYAYQGEIQRGAVEGAPVIVVAWKPTDVELEVLKDGGLIYVSFLGGGLPPHMLCTDFGLAIYPR